jgi:predicted RNA-binding protein with PIN domain
MPDDRKVLDGVERLIVDGNNVLHNLRRTASPLPPATLIGRLRAIVPAGVSVIVILDGSPEQGLVSRRVASGVEVRYSGSWTADDVIARMAEREFANTAHGTLVITDDIALSATVRRAGGRTARNSWLLSRLDRQRLSAPSAGRPGPQSAGAVVEGGGHSGAGGRASGQIGAGAGPVKPAPAADAGDNDGPRWEPGRGATRKRGNGKRRPTAGGRGPARG